MELSLSANANPLHFGRKHSSVSSLMLSQKQRIISQAIPGLQSLAVQTRADQTLYCGTRGCGKTAAQLLFFRSQVGRGWGERYIGILLDTEYKALEDIKAQGKKLFYPINDCVFKEAIGTYYFEWKTGERLYLRAADNLADATKHLGHEYSVVMFNELSKYPTSEVYDHFLANMRVGDMSIDRPPTKVFSTTNPWGGGAVWIKERFVDPMPEGTLYREPFEVHLGDGRYKTVIKTKVTISGNYTQNPYYTPEDVANLMESVRNDPERQAAWLHCDWNAAFVDGAFGDLWKDRVHVIEDFPIPANWRVDRSLDWASSTPFSVCWFAESNGEDVTYKNRTYNYPRGSIIMFSEWYGSRDGKIGHNKGSRLSATALAEGIKEREKAFYESGILQSGCKVYAGAADNQIANVNEISYDTLKQKMEQLGVFWEVADKSPGSRIQGFGLTRQALSNSLTKEGSGLYCQRRCRRAIQSIPSLMRDKSGKEDIDKNQEDHIYDAIRYRLLATNRGVLDASFQLR